ncbi:acyl-CoA dehydrogenase family protein [Marinobacter sp. ANT_B65]|uniref:acyl-CoA dehydrogenase family protein n=1 Tax=Marinobacter sp. ANT_B65 TaxID=2039467 RepID=UPI000BBE1D65|nr:acyl-CoA dehydrogenase family protein [Marinobacter sp. ANT_B65]PCM43256.1 acyl-CoA dehydrogenase [Marinobacter sp. ANT_B65]
MNFDLPDELIGYLAELDQFIEAEIKPLQAENDNERFFDHRREWARTDFDNQGLPRPEWEALLAEVRRRADRAGHLRFALPVEFSGKSGSNLWMAVIREHLAAKGLGLHNDLQNEHSIVGNKPFVLVIRDFGTPEQQETFIKGMLDETIKLSFGLTEADHGSDATHMDTTARQEPRDGQEGWRIDGGKMWTTGLHTATHIVVFARTSGEDGDAKGITAFLVPSATDGICVEEYLWTFNMPTDHPRVSFTDVWVPSSTVLGDVGGGLAIAQHFVHQNRIRQAASSLGAADFCIRESVKYARERKPFGQELARNQGIQFPLVELATRAEMLRAFIRQTAWQMDRMTKKEVEKQLSDKVSMCNYTANQLCCEAADTAMQVHGGMGYSRHKPFEHIYRHHRRYRITEGSDEIQKRKIGAYLFGYIKRSPAV